ncbi:hypothetical protein Pisl_1929 [Pyrobaculum islandicum DSM 4184]|uniref:Uncharacterized protein n=1 Tax=Pyrobaculum islandicum (strain DSM 4184 / JCM 9189 / GEO3) TaxID=384616 RepID=A1RVU4_PYRIL|nr:hypothetical protein [Pyrobaculum islandicum]ABL89076.1 hypothetical protein Pisl_1929 [Pyrobaculum islandicum DSM 4184]
MSMPSQTKVPDIQYWDENWWRCHLLPRGATGCDIKYTTLGDLYAKVLGFVSARENLLRILSDDLGQVLKGPHRELALRILLGGVSQDCVKSGVMREECIPKNSMAYFYRQVLGIGLGDDLKADIDNRNRLLAKARHTLLEEAAKGFRIQHIKSEHTLMEWIIEIYNLLDYLYLRTNMRVNAEKYDVKDAQDLVNAFVDVINAAVGILPLYNPFTFFLQSLGSTPRPYLKLMYGEELFSDKTKALMERFGIKLTVKLVPDLGGELDRELAVVGHTADSVGNRVLRLLDVVYDLMYRLSRDYNLSRDELREYVTHYSSYIDRFSTEYLAYYYYHSSYATGYIEKQLDKSPLIYYLGFKLEVKASIVNISDSDGDFVKGCKTSFCENPRPRDGARLRLRLRTISYSNFLEVFSQLLFLGLARLETKDLKNGVLYVFI